MSGLGSKRRRQWAAQIAMVLGVWLLGGWLFYGDALSLGEGGGFLSALKPQPQPVPMELAAGQHLNYLNWATGALPQAAGGVLNAAGDRWQQLLQVWLPLKLPAVSKSTKWGKKSDRLMLADLARPAVSLAAKLPKSSDLNLPAPFSAAPPDEPQGRSPDSDSELPQAPEPLPKHQIAVLKGHQRAVWSVAFSSDGQRLATASTDGTARLWSLDGDELAAFSVGDRAVWSVAFSPDGQHLATASADGTARLWSLDGRELAVFCGHERAVWSVVFSPDGQRLATAGADGTARLWNPSGQPLATFSGHSRAVWDIDAYSIMLLIRSNAKPASRSAAISPLAFARSMTTAKDFRRGKRFSPSQRHSRATFHTRRNRIPQATRFVILGSAL
jgi:WD40 repeat protein